jgi:hypothetical protein
MPAGNLDTLKLIQRQYAGWVESNNVTFSFKMVPASINGCSEHFAQTTRITFFILRHAVALLAA